MAKELDLVNMIKNSFDYPCMKRLCEKMCSIEVIKKEQSETTLFRPLCNVFEEHQEAFFTLQSDGVRYGML